jgi:hypothetical protein
VADQGRRTRLLGESHVLGQAMLDQRSVKTSDGFVLVRARMHPVAEEEWGETRQRREMVMRIDRVVQSVAKQCPKVVREPVRIDALALDQAGISERRLLAGVAAVDEQRGPSPLLQMQRNRGPDDSGPEHHHVHFHILIRPS